jgi:exopolysaccharide production protein ExoZ
MVSDSSTPCYAPSFNEPLVQGKVARVIGRNHGLDGLRGIAVILTYLVHYCGTYMATFRGANPNVVALAGWPEPFDKAMYWLFRSHHGVYIFFLLSGFLITKIALRRDFSYLPFVRNRILRIYPAFLLALVICVVAGFFVHIPVPGWREVALNLLFLNGVPALGVTGIVFNNVTWSLFYEMVFYLSLPFVVLLSRRLAIPLFGAIVSAGIVFAYGPSLIGFYSEFFLFLFAGSIIGALSPAGVKIVADSFPDAIVAALYCAVGWLMAAGYLTTAQFVWLFAGLGVIIVCKAIGGKGTLARCLAWTPLVRLGRISYSFYLLHSVALAALFTFWWRLWLPPFGTIGNAVYLGAFGFAVAVGLAWLSFVMAERFYFMSREPVAVTMENR